MADFPWDALLNAASLAMLGRNEEAKQKLFLLLEMVPGIKINVRSFISLFLLSDELVDGLYVVLQKAGEKSLV